jgi:hypothetical protein
MNTLQLDNRIKEVPYDEFLRYFKYTQSQHVTICGPTGCGKSVLLTDLLIPCQPYPVFLSTKPRDATIEDSELFGKDWGWTDDPDDIHPDVHNKWVVGLKQFGDPEDVKERHKALFGRTLRKCYGSSGWAVNVDEGRYVCDPKYLGLHAIVAQYYFQGRSDFKSVVLATQRPSWVPLEAFDMATHLFFFNDDDERNVDTMAGAAGANRKLFLDTIPHLDTTEFEGGQFLYYNRSTKVKLISKVEM